MDTFQMSSDENDPFNTEKTDSQMSHNFTMEDTSSLDSLFAAHDSTIGADSSSHGSPTDWSQLSASSFWPIETSRTCEGYYPDVQLGAADMDFLQQMDMDFNPSMAIDPTALDFNYGSEYYDPSKVLATDIGSFPFTFSSHPSPASMSSNSNDEFPKERRLSVTSSSGASSSGASLSPVMERNHDADAAADELAARVRQTAGVLLAVPNGSPQSQFQPQPQQPKLPIPRFPTQIAKPKSALSTAPASVASSASSSPAPEDALSNPTATTNSASNIPAPRTKTSHTTIERRYRTNLNARIQSLRQAVPALRVLEDKGLLKKGKKDGEGIVTTTITATGSMDVVDERGFVDGVKVARKCSKANVLGKAVEYIRVLKKREARLTREQSGLKCLIGGLVGGPALLKEWEHEWAEKFGGKERDEVEGEEVEPMSDDEEGDDDAEDEDDGGRAKKKAKLVKASPKPATAVKKTVVVGDGVVLEKRKRGRPRKVLATPTPPAPETPAFIPPVQPVSQQPQQQPVGPQPQQYLLATFALFSFFNSPLTATSSASPHTHSGSVLGPATTQSMYTYGYGWREFIQVFHLAVSALVFFSIVVPWLPRTMKRARLLSPFSPPTNHSHTKPAMAARDRTTLVDALMHSRRGSVDEAEQLHAALGVPSGVLGLVMGWKRNRGSADGAGFERKGLEQRAWVRLGELVALNRTTSTATRLQAYLSMRSHISWFKASTSDLSTLALVLRPLSAAKAGALWNRAAKTEFVRPFEKLVLSSLTLEEAAERIALLQQHPLKNTETVKLTPVGLLAAMLIRERLLQHMSALFVRTVLPNHSQAEENWVHAEWDIHEEDERRVESINAGKSLGGRTRELAEAVEKVWATTGARELDDILDLDQDQADNTEREIRALLNALILYRRIFPSAILSCTGTGIETVSFILSPPPSPSRKDAQLHLALRRVLASDVFDSRGTLEGMDGDLNGEKLCVALEDARDRAVDMLVEYERAGSGRAQQ